MDVDERVRLALEMIPTCERCKRLRRKCDTELPACRLCRATNRNCEFEDKVLQETVSRSQVKELVDKWLGLRHEEDAPSGEESESFLCDGPPLSQNLNLDAHFPAPDHSDDTFLFFGSSSAHVFSVELLAVLCPQSPILQTSRHLQLDSVMMAMATPGLANEVPLIVPTKALILRLVDAYTRSCMVFWPLHLECLENDGIDDFFEATQQQTTNVQPYTKSEAHSNFRIAMVCSIGAAHCSRLDVTMSAYEQFFYNFALRLIKEVLSEASNESLTSLMLVTVYLLFRPRKGDLWLQLESACRLAIELGYHREDAPFPETPEQKVCRGNTFWTLYRLEHMVAETYGRPSDDLEAIITTELPYLSTSVTMSPRQMQGIHTSPANLASSLARLSVIRSHIFKNIYLPADAAPLTADDPFYRVQLQEIEQWRQDCTAEATDALTHLAFTTAYHASVIFLFQKSLLLVLSALADPNRAGQAVVGTIAAQSFASAVELIKCYEKLILSDESRRLAHFPVTVMSAHEVYVAALTFLACCFCSLDGRVKLEDFGGMDGKTMVHHFPWPRLNGSLMMKEEGPRLHRLSSSCLSLLTWCSMQWPGMDGMLEIYREVSTEFFRKVVAGGLA